MENKAIIKEKFNNSDDLILYQFDTLGDTEVLLVYINALIDKKALNEFVIKPMKNNLVSAYDIESSIYVSEIQEIFSINESIKEIVDGSVVVYIDGIDTAYAMNMCRYDKRSVAESTVEQVIRGPKESFVEDIYVNKSLIRRKIRNHNLIFEQFTLGEMTNTQVCIVYIKGIVNKEILEELKARLSKIKTDAVLDTSYIEEYIDDSPSSLVRTVYHTEKPDVLAGKILEGRIGIICDGSPSVATVPKIFIEDLMDQKITTQNLSIRLFLELLDICHFYKYSSSWQLYCYS